jgi:hypothetical protein
MKLYFVVSLLGLALSAFSQDAQKPTWMDFMRNARDSFDATASAMITHLERKDYDKIYEFAHGDFSRKVERQRFLDSLTGEFAPIATEHTLLGKEIVFTGDAKDRPDRALGTFYMSAIVSFAIRDKRYYAHWLWELDRSLNRWQFRNFPFAYSSLPANIRLAGLENVPDHPAK